MKLKVMGMLAGLAWSGAALAQGSQEPSMPQEPPTQQDSSMQQDPSMQQPSSGGSQMSGGMGGSQAQGQQELSGSVVAMRRDKVYIKDENGAVVPIGVNHSTQIDGKPIEKHRDIHSHLRRELKEGDQVRTRFNVEKTTENMASSIEKMSK
ncbi:hypothetical protein [Myxococcus sp. Y35]|uniref:hypothetical protein n=1 Tax=Pseudomyxococcus flavus TaxID=3115648 RepID=UPI003CEE399D